MKINVGDYVRTPRGIIAKIINIQEDTGQYFLNGNAVSLKSKNYIADKNITIGENFKHSPDIIDLIEVGDYVNGSEVIKKHYTYMGEHFIDLNTNDSWEWGIGKMPIKYIKSIVTKEQFEAMQYVVRRD